MSQVKVARLSDLPEAAGTRVDVAGHSLVLVRLGDVVYVLDDTCSHEEASLSEGEVYEDDREIECPLHGSTFHLETGAPTCLPATEPVATYAVRFAGDDVLVELG